MIIDFFGTDIPKRAPAERYEILKKLRAKIRFSQSFQEYGYDYFDNPDLGIGYGGYKYDGRYKSAVESMVDHYGLSAGDRILEIGCAKGFILVEFKRLGFEVYGVDASAYAVEQAHPEVAEHLQVGDASELPFEDNFFALVLGKEVLPHIPEDKIETVIRECARVAQGNVFFEIGYASTEEAIESMLEWDLTHACAHTLEWWEQLFNKLGKECDRHYKPLF